MAMTAELFRKLAAYDTATICNVIELFDVRPRNEGYMDGRIRAAQSDLPPMVGLAATASFRSCSPGLSGDVYASLERQLQGITDMPGPAVMVYQDLDDPPVGATFGEVMCSAFQAFGAAGLVTSGGGRDLEQIRTLHFPVFLGSVICSHGYCQTFDVGRPVRVGGLVVRPGDLLHGDADGVTSIPIDLADEIADAAEEFMAAEKHVIEYARAEGPKDLSEMLARRRAMVEEIAALGRRLSRRRKG